MSVRLSPNLPANVVEIGNEISQAKINEINAGTLATQSWVGTQGYLTSSSLVGYATQSYVTSQGYLTDAPNNGSEYVRKNGAWAVATGGGGGGSVAWGSITGTLSSQTDLTSYITGLGYQTATDVSTYVTGLGYQTSSDVSTALADYLPLAGGTMDSTASITLSDATVDSYVGGDGFGVELTADTTQQSWQGYDQIYVKNGSYGVTLSTTGITFPDTSVQTVAGYPNTNPDAQTYGRNNGNWAVIPYNPTKSLNYQTSSYTLSASDANNIVYSTTSPIIIPKDSTHNFDIGTIITVCVDSSSFTIQSEDTMMAQPNINGSSGSTTISNGALLVKVASDSWKVF